MSQIDETLFVGKAVTATRSSASVLSSSEFSDIRNRALGPSTATRRAQKQQQRIQNHKISQQRVSQWNNTLEGRRREKELERQRRKQQEEDRLLAIDREEAALRQKQREELLSKAAEHYLYEDEDVQEVLQKSIALSLLDDNKKQIEYKDQHKQREKAAEQSFDKGLDEDVEHYLAECEEVKQKEKCKRDQLRAELKCQLDKKRDQIMEEIKENENFDRTLLEKVEQQNRKESECEREKMLELKREATRVMKENAARGQKRVQNQKEEEELSEYQRKRNEFMEKVREIEEQKRKLPIIEGKPVSNNQKEEVDVTETFFDKFGCDSVCKVDQNVVDQSRKRQLRIKKLQKEKELAQEKELSLLQSDTLKILEQDAVDEVKMEREKARKLAEYQRKQTCKKSEAVKQNASQNDELIITEDQKVQNLVQKVLEDHEKQGHNTVCLKRKLNKPRVRRSQESTLILM
ncbi:hypothetical protein P9112_014672 [Eukaryota sp. TZLM1-RC]